MSKRKPRSCSLSPHPLLVSLPGVTPTGNLAELVQGVLSRRGEGRRKVVVLTISDSGSHSFPSLFYDFELGMQIYARRDAKQCSRPEVPLLSSP